MEQDVDTGYRTLCCTCLSSDRNVTSINGLTQVYQMFRLIMYDYAGDRFGDSVIELDQLVCWECLALMKKLARFKRQVHSAQEHLRVLAMSQSQETMDHTYMSQSLSSLESVMKTDFDQILVDYTMQDKEWPHYISISTEENVKNEGYDVAQALRDHITLSIDDQVNVMGVPELVLENPVTGVMSHIVVNSGSLVTDFHNVKREMPELTIDPTLKPDTVIISQNPRDAPKIEKPDLKSKYTKEYMTEEEMLALREEAKQKVQYVSSVYKCELCIIGFYTQQQVEDHFVAMHREKPGYVPCKVCYIYTPEAKMSEHTDTHYSRYVCKLCNKHENSQKLMLVHLRAHENKTSRALIPIDVEKKSRKKKGKIIEEEKTPPKPGDLRKLLSKTTIVGYKCLECDMFFKNSRARKNHVDRFHREGLQCDHCKKRFVNRTTLATHLRLHEGPLPREECPVCHKMVRTIQIKYHIQRHQSTTRYECRDCDKVFSHLATYQAHLKFSRAHASDQVFNAIEMEVVPDIYQPSPQTRPYSNAERQKRYRDKKKAGKMTSSASTSFSESINVETQQEQQHYVQISKSQPQSNAERQRKYRKLLREKLQKQQKEDINTITPTTSIHHLQKFPCPMCNKGYPTKQAMQDHFNYQHLNKTTHKCPVCSKPIASKANVEKHMMRVHGEKKSKPRKHVCQLCGKGFTDKKALTQHEVIHSGERPLSCDICQQTFKQKASLYTHKKRVHKVFPTKRVVEFMDTTD